MKIKFSKLNLTGIILSVLLVLFVFISCSGTGQDLPDEDVDGKTDILTTPVSWFNINNSDGYTSSTFVWLYHQIPSEFLDDIEFIRVINEDDDWGDWQLWDPINYLPSQGWGIFPGDGLKTVSVQYKDDRDVVYLSTYSIFLDSTIININSFSINNGAEYTNSTSLELNYDVTGTVIMDFSSMAFYFPPPIGWTGFNSPEPFYESPYFFLSTIEGTRKITAEFTNISGDSEYVSATIIIDLTPPDLTSVEANSGDTHTPSTTVTVDINGSGGSFIQIREALIWGSVWDDYATPKTYVFGSSKNGTKTIYVRTKDLAGNISEIKSDTIILDTVFPVFTSFLIENGTPVTFNNTVILYNNVTDATWMRFKNEDDLIWGNWIAFSSTTEFELGGYMGNVTVYAEFKDDAGNTVSAEDDIMLSL